MARKEPAEEPDVLKRSKKEWIESAAYFGAESFEVAGALFDLQNEDLAAENEVKKRLAKYRGGEK